MILDKLGKEHNDEKLSRRSRNGYEPELLFTTVDRRLVVCMVITYSRAWINRERLPILLEVS